MDQGELRRTRRSAKSAKAGRAASVAGLKAPCYTDLENAVVPGAHGQDSAPVNDCALTRVVDHPSYACGQKKKRPDLLGEIRPTICFDSAERRQC